MRRKEYKLRKVLQKSYAGRPSFLLRSINYKVRQLGLEHTQSSETISFVSERRNLIIWGLPGAGKTWFGKVFATKACQEIIRTKWITYPFLCRELMQLKRENSKRLKVRIKYFCGFDLFCIDEFPNYDVKDKFLMQESFNQAKLDGHSLIVCMRAVLPGKLRFILRGKEFRSICSRQNNGEGPKIGVKGPNFRNYIPG